MPAPIVFKNQGVGPYLYKGLSSLGEALGEYGEKNRQGSALSALNEALKQGDQQGIIEASNNAIKAGIQPAQIQISTGLYQQQREQTALEKALDESGGYESLKTEEGKNKFVDSYVSNGGNLFNAMKLFKDNGTKQTIFQKKIEEKKADAVIDFLDTGGESPTKFLNENLDFLQENLKNVGKQAAITGIEYGPFTGELFTEYGIRGKLILDGVIKIFNKTGQLPKGKLAWLNEEFAISPYDTQAQIQGKINGIRTISKGANELAQRMGTLIEKYGENIPNEEFLKLRQDANDFIDNARKEYELSKEKNEAKQVSEQPKESKQTFEKLPPASSFSPGQMIKNPETGEILVTDGKRWSKQKSGAKK